MKRWTIVLPAASLLAVYLYIQPDPGPEEPSIRVPQDKALDVPAGDKAYPAASSAKLPEKDDARHPGLAIAASLLGTEMDGGIALDSNGNLVRSASLRRLFDYWLTTLGEQDLDSIRAQIAELAEQSGGARIAAEVLGLFDDYVAYLQAAESISPDSMTPDALLAVHDALHALRREYLGHWADAFFGADEAALIEQIAQMQIRQDPELDPEARQYLLERWEETLPENVRQARFAATAHLDVVNHTRTMRQEGMSDEQKWLEWGRAYGAQAADRLAAVESSRAEFAEARDAFIEEYQDLMSDRMLNDQQRELAITALLSGYTDPQRRRLLALARLPEGAMDPEP